MTFAACGGPSTDPPPPIQERELQGPFLGQTVHAVDLDGDGRSALALSAPGLIADGGVYRFDTLGDHTLADADAAIVAALPADIGPGFAGCGDVDGDGVGDWLVGAPDRDRTGGAWLVHGPIQGTITLGDQPFADGLVREGRAGFTVACGDIDDDGLADLALSAPDTDGFGIAQQTGSIALHAGPDLDNLGSFGSTWSNSHLGFRHALVMGTDIDGDGVGDLAIGAHGSDRVHLVFGPLGGSYDANSAGPMLTGVVSEGTGHALAVGDVNGDGAMDLVIGAPFARDRQGAVWVVAGPIDADTSGEIDNQNAWRIDGISDGDEAGFSLALADVDDDGSDDLWVGAPATSGAGQATGAAYLVFGPGDGIDDLDQAAGRALGDIPQGRLGWSVAAGDLDGDGQIELVAGAPETDIGAVLGAGQVFAWSASSVRGAVHPDTAILTVSP